MNKLSENLTLQLKNVHGESELNCVSNTVIVFSFALSVTGARITDTSIVMNTAALLYNSSRWHWQWENFCGPEGFKIWSPERHDLGYCFQQICLQIPVFVILAIISSYYFGLRKGFVTRGPVQLISIHIRCLMILVSALLPVLQIYIYLNKTDAHIYSVSYFLFAVEGISWLTHLGYTWSLRKRLGLSPRGPVLMCVTWTLLFMLDILSLRTHLLIYQNSLNLDYGMFVAYAFSICNVLAQVFYGLTLLPGEGSTTYVDFSTNYVHVSSFKVMLLKWDILGSVNV